MRPHADYNDRLINDLVNKPVLTVYPSRIQLLEISRKLLVRRRILEWIFS